MHRTLMLKVSSPEHLLNVLVVQVTLLTGVCLLKDLLLKHFDILRKHAAAE